MNIDNTEKIEVVGEKTENKVRNIDKLKAILKERAEYIRSERRAAGLLKEAGQGPRASTIHNSLLGDSRWYRHYHIAYCELRGKTRDQIEKPGEYHKANELEIERIKNEYAWSPEEIVRYNERKARREEALHSC